MMECLGFDVAAEDPDPRLLGDPLARLGLAYPADPAARFRAWLELERGFASYGCGRHLVALEHGHPAGHLSVTLNSRLPPAGAVAYLGLASLPAPDGGRALEVLLPAALDWCRDRGVRTLRGHIAYSTWFPNRCITDDAQPDRFPGDSVCGPEVTRLLLSSGFSVSKTYFSALTEPLALFASRIAPVARFARSRGLSFERVRGEGIAPLFAEAHALSLKAFADNYSFTPIDLEEFVRIYSPATGLPDATALAARAGDGRMVGFAFGYGAPNFRIDGVTAARVGVLKSIATDPDFSGTMVGAALSAGLHEAFASPEMGYGYMIHALMAREQYAVGARSQTVSLVRSYAMLEREVG